MAAKFSKALVDAVAAGRAVVNVILQGDTYSYGDGTGTGSTDQILDSANGLAVFHVGDMITVDGSTSNDGTYEILAVTAAAIEVVAGSLTTEAAGDPTALASARGHSFSDLFRHGVMRIYSGSRPATPETTEAGTLLLEISEASGAFTGGVDANGLRFDAVIDGVVSKETTQVWSDVALDTGTATWGRFYDNALNDGSDGGEAYIRFDFDVALSGAELNMNTAVVVGTTKTVDSFTITVPVQ